MVKRISDWLRQVSTGWVALAALLIFLLFTALVLPQQAAKSEQETGSAVSPDTSFFYMPADLYQIAEGTHNYVVDNYTLPNGYSGIFPNNPQPGGDKLYCITYNATRPDVHASLDEGRWVSIYSGHGSWTGWEFYGASDVRTLTNGDMFPFVASHACITGDFAQDEVYGETWVLQPLSD